MVKKLKIFDNFKIPNKFKKSIILIGNFDGLHSGHQKLFELAKKYKTKYKRSYPAYRRRSSSVSSVSSVSDVDI